MPVPALGDVGLMIAAALAGYLAGTFPTARLVTRLVTRGAVDIRAVGSGNPGGLNTLQAVGRASGVIVILVDLAKGMGAGFLGWWIAGAPGAYAGATAAVVGHVLPVWSRFWGAEGFPGLSK